MADVMDGRLLLLVERIERISDEIKGLQDDRKDVYSEAKAVGYDLPTLRTVIARRAMEPNARSEADMLVETYEAALEGAPDPAVDPDTAAREMAQAVLAEQIEGISDPQQAALLVEHVTVLLDIRAEISGLRAQESHRKTLAKGEGFLPKQLSAVVRWLEKCAKHGRDTMRAGEATFHLYRGTIEARGGNFSGALGAAPVSTDPKLQETFGKAGTAAQRKKLDTTLAWLETGLGD